MGALLPRLSIAKSGSSLGALLLLKNPITVNLLDNNNLNYFIYLSTYQPKL